MAKAANWNVVEEMRLIMAVQDRYSVLYGAFKGSSRGKEARKTGWEEVGETINACSMGEKRTGEQAKKKYENMKTRVKAKIDMLKRPPTGGGMCPQIKFTESEELLASYIGSSPSVAGLQGGIDTEAPSTSSDQRTQIDDGVLASVSTCCDRTANCDNVSPLNCIVDNEGFICAAPASPAIAAAVAPTTPSNKKKSLGKRKEELTVEILKEEVKKLKAETEKILTETAMIKDKHILIKYKLQFYKEKVSTDFQPEI